MKISFSIIGAFALGLWSVAASYGSAENTFSLGSLNIDRLLSRPNDVSQQSSLMFSSSVYHERDSFPRFSVNDSSATEGTLNWRDAYTAASDSTDSATILSSHLSSTHRNQDLIRGSAMTDVLLPPHRRNQTPFVFRSDSNKDVAAFFAISAAFIFAAALVW
ncbi:hypothetical protein K3495_g6708 [Podosphaera aphanis]|nr:hypothetical protein K3495_g6708 [Podosphaera aphanis]